jgi:hypothetical protein
VSVTVPSSKMPPWRRFIEAPNGPADMARLINHLGLAAYSPEYGITSPPR